MREPGLDSHIRRLRRRVRFLLIERGSLFGASAGVVAAVVLVLLSSRFDRLIDYRLWAGVIALGALAGGAVGLLRRLDDLTVASAADARIGLKERLSTAVSLTRSGGNDGMEEAVLADARDHITGVRSREVFHHRFGLPHGVFGIALVALLAVMLLPMLPVMQSKARRAEVTVMKHEGARLVKIAKDIRKQARPEREELRKLANRLEELGQKMQSGRLEKKKAMLKAQQLSKEVQKQQDELAKANQAKKSMAQAKLDMQKASEELAKKMAEKLADKESIPLSEAMKKLPSDRQLAELARKPGELSAAEQKALEESIAKYADPENTLAIPSELGEALAKLAQNKDYQKAMELMQKLAQKLNSGKMSEMDKEALQKQLEQLAEALKGTDLDKLARMMRESAEKLAAMSPEELEKLLKEMEEMRQMAEMLAKAGEG